MLDFLVDRFTSVFSRLSGQKIITENSIEEGVDDIRKALLAADVSIPVINDIIAKIKENAFGQKVTKSVSPVQEFIHIVNNSLIGILGSEKSSLLLAEPTACSKILLCGLQGSGKTTTCAKLARFLKEKRNILLVSLDINRAAAQEQLVILGRQIGVDVFDRQPGMDIKKTISLSRKQADTGFKNCIIYDTAGRVQIDSSLMSELGETYSLIKPDETLLVCDAMTGQAALSVAVEFSKTVKLSGLVFTKFDSDARGGAVLSVKHVTGQPVKFIGTGEKIGDLDEFDPARIAGRILGMGDVVKLVESAKQQISEEKAKKLQEKIKKNSFSLQDFLEQLEAMQNMGPLENVMKMIPGMQAQMKNTAVDDRDFIRMKAIIQSMTPKERENENILNGSRRLRIAGGSGSTVPAVNQVIKRFEEMKKMMKKMNTPEKMKKFYARMGLSEAGTQALSSNLM
ncbi:MAG: signal recognition particle protein [Spirochaetes bacterium GWF1_41_5]|nr:MAG: signal recognition particle protein [Spirochaetes bacterium GWF1_41_5]